MVEPRTPVALLVTGLYRSGTTLVEKTLDQHPRIAVASQPAPLLWSTMKSEFLGTLGVHEALPFGPLFREERYRREELTRWLADREVTSHDLTTVETDLAGYDGWWSPQLSGRLARLGADTPADVARAIAGEAAALRGRAVDVVGLKEILVEELIDHFHERGFVSVVVVRDPIDVLLSLFRGAGQRIMGAPRPTLFHVRQWRRSVALALSGPAVVVRYEDVVRDPARALAPVADALGVEREGLPASLDDLRDQHGRPWGGNSSFESVRPEASDELTRYVEALTGPELVALGYRTSWRLPELSELARFREPVEISRDDVPRDLSTQRDELEAELRRLRLLATDDVGVGVQRSWLLDAHAAIRGRAGDPGPETP